MTDLPKLNTPARALALLLAPESGGHAGDFPYGTLQTSPDHRACAARAPGSGGHGGDAIGALMQEVAKNPQNVDALLHLVEALMTAQNWRPPKLSPSAPAPWM